MMSYEFMSTYIENWKYIFDVPVELFIHLSWKKWYFNKRVFGYRYSRSRGLIFDSARTFLKSFKFLRLWIQNILYVSNCHYFLLRSLATAWYNKLLESQNFLIWREAFYKNHIGIWFNERMDKYLWTIRHISLKIRSTRSQ